METARLMRQLMGKVREAKTLCYLHGATKLGRGRAGISHGKSFLLKSDAFLALAPEFAATREAQEPLSACQYSNSSVPACLRETVGFYGLRSNWKEERLGLP